MSVEERSKGRLYEESKVGNRDIGEKNNLNRECKNSDDELYQDLHCCLKLDIFVLYAPRMFRVMQERPKYSC